MARRHITGYNGVLVDWNALKIKAGTGILDTLGEFSVIYGKEANTAAEGDHVHTASEIEGLFPLLDQLHVYPWAKAPTKPRYTFGEVGAAPLVHGHIIDDIAGLEDRLAAVEGVAGSAKDSIDSLDMIDTLYSAGPGIRLSGSTFSVIYGTNANTSAAGNDTRIVNAVQNTDRRLTDARDWDAEIVSKAEAEAGTSTTPRKWTAQRVKQAVEKLQGNITGLGVGQTWRSKSVATRATTHTNTTSNPIFVTLSANNTSSGGEVDTHRGTVYIRVGSTIIAEASSVGSHRARMCVSAVIPPGTSYTTEVTSVGASYNPNPTLAELR